jgi:hypothetical protein
MRSTPGNLLPVISLIWLSALVIIICGMQQVWLLMTQHNEGPAHRLHIYAKAADYQHVAKFARHSLDWLSHKWPGIPYPYEKSTVFQGFAGMEYPMMGQ